MSLYLEREYNMENNQAITVEDMFNTMGGGQSVSLPKSGGPTGTLLAGQVGPSGKISTILGGQASGLAFYGGETAAQIKSASKLTVVGGIAEKKSVQDKCFYNNVHIPKKKV